MPPDSGRFFSQSNRFEKSRQRVWHIRFDDCGYGQHGNGYGEQFRLLRPVIPREGKHILQCVSFFSARAGGASYNCQILKSFRGSELSTIASTQTHAKFKVATQKRSDCGIGCSGKVTRERGVVAIVNLQ